MNVDPEFVKMLCVVAYGVLPFLLGGIALWLNSRNTQSKYVIGIAVASAICGVFTAIAILSSVQISKYPETDFTFGIVFVIWFASVGAIIGAVIDRARFGAASGLHRTD